MSISPGETRCPHETHSIPASTSCSARELDRRFGVAGHEPKRRLPCALTADGDTLGCGIVTSSERRVLELQFGGLHIAGLGSLPARLRT
jgi:hypothetical protein